MKRTISRCLAGALVVMFMITTGEPAKAAGWTNQGLLSTAPGVVEEEDPAPETEVPEEDTSPETKEPVEEDPVPPDDPSEQEAEEPDDPISTPATQRTGQEKMTGAVEVLITAGVPVNEAQEYQIELKGPASGTQSQKAVLQPAAEDALRAPQTSVRFSGLDAGKYELKVTGSGYAAYTQTIQVDGLAYRVQLYTGEAAVGSEKASPGLLAKGDLNGDGKLDAKDTELLIDAIDAGAYQEQYDLYGDGIIDLKDLNHLTRLLGNQKEATLEKFIPLDAADLTLTQGTLQAGSDIERFLNGEDGLTVSLSGGVAELTFDFEKYAKAPVMEEILIGAPSESGNAILEGVIAIDTEDGRSLAGAISSGGSMTQVAAVEKSFDVSVLSDGSISINLNGQIAVKRVTLRITKTADSRNLAEISSVEFVNDMESRIPEPEMNIPKNVKTVPGNKSFTVTWDRQYNVTAYEVRIVSEGETDYRRTTSLSMTVQEFQGGKMKNDTPYEVSVQSLNGEWKSGYSEVSVVTPKADHKPAAPEAVSVTGGYRYLDVRWKKMEDTDSYRLFYKEDGADQYEVIDQIEGTYWRITGLKDDTRYVLYLTGVNELGEGPASKTAAGSTISGLIPAKLPAYKLINTSNGEGKLSAHIVSATIGGGSVSMADSPLDQEPNSALGAFDNRYASYIDRQDWDYGGAYPASGKGVTVQLDEVYEIGMITLAQPMDEGNFAYVNVQYWDENGKQQTASGVTIAQKRSDNRNWYLIKFKEPLKTSKLQLGVGHQYGYYKVAISEIRFHEYDSLEQDILNLYADDLFITLRDGVNQETIDALQTRLDTPDPVSGEYHPEKEALQEELDGAKALLATKGLGEVIQVNSNVTASKDSKISVGGLMARQPLGVTAAAGDRLVVYVGNPGMKSGTKTQNLDLVFTQQHAESGGLSQRVTLSIGRNEITVPSFCSTEVEKGGPIYIQYRGNNPEDQYAVRVSGGTSFPILNVYRVTDAERQRRIQAYVEELRAYVAKLSETHSSDHASSQNENVNRYAYDARTCILNTTDIVTDYMMLSVPASQVLAGLGDDAVSRLTNSLKAMDQMMLLFYQHKGLTDSFADGTSGEIVEKNHLPYECLNIRYMTMFDGAFMYAAGDHVGIEWGSVPGLMSGVPVQADANGKYQSGNYFGWGIAHEIGHQINQGAYAHAEVTNNYYSILAQARDTNNTVRFQYPEVFKKVTSGTTGYASNVFTQLGMYWQLHLAYDKDYNYKTYGTWQEMQEHLFFARVDRYARDAASAPSPKGVALSLTGGRDQNLMRLASAAAERDLTEFFTRWGMTPDAETISYMGQFAKETRAIYYVDDTARVYQMTNEAASSAVAKPSVKVSSNVLGMVSFTISSSAASETIQGYEITRVFTEWGEERREIAGFTQDGSFTDQAAFAAGRVITYEIRAVDKWLNYSDAYRTSPVRITGSGILDKSSWTVETNLISKDDQILEEQEDLPCEKVVESAVTRVINGDYNDSYTGTVSGEDPYILLKLNRVEGVAALNYACASGDPIQNYRIEISVDGETYQEVEKGTFVLGDQNARVNFMDEEQRLCTYDAAFVKLTAVGQAGKNLSLTELDLYGPSGDQVEISQEGIGILSADYVYDSLNPANKIPKGSILFTGSYKGNPAYNVVVLYDENGNIVGGTDAEGTLTAHQIILADPLTDDDALLGDTAKGTWIYWFEPSDPVKADDLPKQVRAELYRVDNALTNEGQRLVSDTAFVEIPDQLPSVDLTKGQ